MNQPPTTAQNGASNGKSARIIAPRFFPGNADQGDESANGTTTGGTGRQLYQRLATKRLAALPEDWAYLAERFKRHLEGARRSPGTVASYLDALLYLVTYLRKMGMPDDPERVNGEHIEQYFVDLIRTGVSPNTAAKRGRDMRPFFKWAENVGEIRPNPMASVTIPQPVDVVKPVYITEDIQSIIDSCDDSTFTGRRDKAAILVLFDCGLRASEFLALSTADVDLRNGVIIVRHPKGKRQRAVALGSEAETALSRYLRQRKRIDTPETALWTAVGGKPLGMAGLRSMAERHGAKGLHVFRHSSATKAAGDRIGELDLLRIYGWNSIAMAKRYTEARGAQLAADAKRRASPGRGLRV